ncbi:MAG TPA: DoxX family protein [Candidatus Acidoferrales bacterium]|nr:DoxX family protein [Candidatus Acidoferrales bacterium]
MSGILAVGKKAYGLFERAASSLQSVLLLVIRLYWGWQLFESGVGKFRNIDKVVEFFGSLNLPAPEVTARLISGLELAGGALLFLGLFSRPISLILTGNMLAAYITADREAFVSFLSDPDKFQGAAPFIYLLVCLIVLVFGPGSLSLDGVISRVWQARESKS